MTHWGQFLYGDADSAIIVRMKLQDGTARDVTGATSIVLRWAAPDGTTGTISGTIVSPASAGQFRFPAPGNVYNPSSGRLIVPIDFDVEWTQSAIACRSREVGRFEIRRFP